MLHDVNAAISPATSDPAGWTVAEWLACAKISRTAEYDLPLELKPRDVKIGRKRLIIESPRDWLLRVRQAQVDAAAAAEVAA